MRKLLPVAAVGCIILSLVGAANAQSGIPWLTDWRQARDMAQQQHRLVLLHFWSETCAPCMRLEQKVFNRPEVARALQMAYIPLKINVDQDPRLADHYGVSVVPTDVIVDESGRVVHRQTSPAEPHQYVAFLDSIKTRHAVAMLPSQPQPVSREERNDTVPVSNRGNFNPPIGRETPPDMSTQNRSSSFVPPMSGGEQLNTATQPATSNPLARTIMPQKVRVGQPYANPFLTAPTSADGENQQLAPSASTADAPAATTPPATQSPVSSPTRTNNGALPTPPMVPAQTPTNTAPSHTPFAPTQNMPSQFTPNHPPAPTAAPPTGWSGQAARQAMVPAAPQRPPIPARAATLGLEGYCPVTLVERDTWARGDLRWGIEHRGRDYVFTSPENQQRFLANPDAYAPVLSGYDPVQYVDSGIIAEGNRRHGLYYGTKYFLFASEANLQKFQADPHRYLPSGMMR